MSRSALVCKPITTATAHEIVYAAKFAGLDSDVLSVVDVNPLPMGKILFIREKLVKMGYNGIMINPHKRVHSFMASVDFGVATPLKLS